MCQAWSECHPGIQVAGAFLSGGRSALSNKRRKGNDPVADENGRLNELVGQQALVIQAQKNKRGLTTVMKRKPVEKTKTEGIPLPAALKVAKLSSSIYHYKSKGEREQRAHDIDLVPTNHEVHQGRKSLSK